MTDQPDTPPLLNLPGDWVNQALCAQVGGEPFFPEKGEASRPARSICRTCTVRAECLDYALANGERYGIWGGLTQAQLRKLTRKLTRDTAA